MNTLSLSLSYIYIYTYIYIHTHTHTYNICIFIHIYTCSFTATTSTIPLTFLPGVVLGIPLQVLQHHLVYLQVGVLGALGQPVLVLALLARDEAFHEDLRYNTMQYSRVSTM